MVVVVVVVVVLIVPIVGRAMHIYTYTHIYVMNNIYHIILIIQTLHQIPVTCNTSCMHAINRFHKKSLDAHAQNKVSLATEFATSL